MTADTTLSALRESGFDPTAPAAARALTIVPAAATDTDGTDVTDRAEPVPAAVAAPETAIEHERERIEQRPDTDGSGAVADLVPPDLVPPDLVPPDLALPVPEPAQVPAGISAGAGPEGLVGGVAGTPGRAARVPRWPLLLIAAGAFVAIWGGWVGLGELTGFGTVRLLPGIADWVVLDTAITLPIGVEAYAALAMRAWLAPPSAGLTRTARRFACFSALGALVLGAAGQVAYHLMTAAGMAQAPWQITAFVSCLPVVVLGCGAALTHLIHQTAPAGKDVR